MMATSYFMTGQKSGSGGGVGFASTVQVIAPDGSVQIRPVNAHGGYVDAAIETYEYDDSLCFMDAVSDLDPGAAPLPLPETNMVTEPLAAEGFAMASWNLDENSSDGYNSIPSEGSWSWNGSTSGGDFRDAQLQTVYDNVDESSGHGSAAQLAQHAPKTSSAKTGSVLPSGRAKAAVNRATTGNSSNRVVAAAAAATTTTTAGAAATGGGDESIQSNNSFLDRVKNAFRDNQTEDQTSHGSGTNSARMATSTNAQTTSALSTAQAAATSATLSQSRATTATVPPQTLPTSLPTSPHPLPTAAAAARPPPTIPPTPPAPPAVPSAYVLLEKQLVDFVCSTHTSFLTVIFCRQLQQ
jgi:hypothetical protein